MLGKNGGKCKNKSDIDLIVKSFSTARIQEMHIMIGQIICELIEKGVEIMSIFLIAEIGINHNGDLEIAKKLINYARDAGFNAVKFQERY